MKLLTGLVLTFATCLVVTYSDLAPVYMKVKLIRAACAMNDAEFDEVARESLECLNLLPLHHAAPFKHQFESCGISTQEFLDNPRKGCKLIEGEFNKEIKCVIDQVWENDNTTLPSLTDSEKANIYKFAHCVRPIANHLAEYFNAHRV